VRCQHFSVTVLYTIDEPGLPQFAGSSRMIHFVKARIREDQQTEKNIDKTEFEAYFWNQTINHLDVPHFFPDEGDLPLGTLLREYPGQVCLSHYFANVYVFTVRLCFTVKNSYYFTNHHILA
jgi:hypothetical protein